MSGAVPLAALAAIWCERWLKYGGGLIVNENGRLSISMAMDKWRWKHGEQHQRLWHDGWFTGRWRELSDLADLVPGLTDAIAEHVDQHGDDCGHGRKWMVRTGDHVGWQAEAEEPARSTGSAG